MLDKYLEIRCEIKIEPLGQGFKSKSAIVGDGDLGHLESLKSQFTQRLGQASMQPRRTNIIDSGPDVSLESNSGVYLSGKAEIGDILDKKKE